MRSQDSFPQHEGDSQGSGLRRLEGFWEGGGSLACGEQGSLHEEEGGAGP